MVASPKINGSLKMVVVVVGVCFNSQGSLIVVPVLTMTVWLLSVKARNSSFTWSFVLVLLKSFLCISFFCKNEHKEYRKSYDRVGPAYLSFLFMYAIFIALSAQCL